MSKLTEISVDGVSYKLNMHKLLNTELIAIERVLGVTSVQWMDQLSSGSMAASTALWWLMLRRHVDPQTDFESISFTLDAIKVNLQDDEDDEEKKEDKTLTQDTDQNESPQPTVNTESVS